MERYNFKTQRLHVAADLTAGASLCALPEHVNYLLNVLRLKSGDTVLVFNGRDGEWLASVEPAGRKSCRLALEKQTRPQPAASTLVYCFAPLKHARLDYMVQKAVEMGAGVLQPVITRHTQVSRLNLERMSANAVEAAEQCGILSVPQCRTPLPLEQLVLGWERDRQLVFCDEASNDSDVIALLQPLKDKKLGLLIGPEGGFSDEEREMLHGCSFVTGVPLGPRILRADTAGVAALALLQAIAGDWPRLR